VLLRDFQVAQEISKREVLRQRLIEVDYRFGQGETTQLLGNLNALDRQKVETLKTWTRLRSQMARIKLLVLGAGEE